MRMGRLKKAIADGSLISNIAPASDADKKELSDWEEATGIDLDDNNTIYGTDSPGHTLGSAGIEPQ